MYITCFTRESVNTHNVILDHVLQLSLAKDSYVDGPLIFGDLMLSFCVETDWIASPY